MPCLIYKFFLIIHNAEKTIVEEGRLFMKIYFSAAIRGSETDQEMIFSIINRLSKNGQVINETAFKKSYSNSETLSDEQIFLRDIKWIEKSDILIADVSSSSIGVGYEIAIAEERGLPIIGLWKKDKEKKCSAMIKGNYKIKLIGYYVDSDLDNINDVLKSI